MNSLATELRMQVVEEAAKFGDLKALRCVNRSFCSLVEPLLFASIRFDSGEDLERGFRILESLAIDKSRVSHHVRTLVIQCKDNMFPPLNYPGFRCGVVEDIEAEQAKIERMKKTQERLDNCLPAAIRALTKITSLRVVANERSLSPASLWTAMGGIKLREVVIQGKIESSCLEYLASCSGLTRLGLLNIDATTEEESNDHATYFAGTILPKHSETLEILEVTGAYSGLWSFGGHNVQEYGRCVHLRELRVSLNQRNFSKALTRYLDFVHERLPRMSSVSLCSVADRRYSWNLLRGAGLIRHSEYMRKLMADAICSFPVPRGFNGDFQVNAANQVFVSKEAEGGTRRYHCITCSLV